MDCDELRLVLLQEDTRANCDTLTPKPHGSSPVKFAQMDGKVLRFTARLAGPEDAELTAATSSSVSNGQVAAAVSRLLAAHPPSPLYVSASHRMIQWDLQRLC